MTAVGQWRATYAPGDWLVLCGPTSVVVIEPPGAGWTELAAELWREVLASSSLVDLAARLAAYGLDTMPSFGALFWSADGMRSLVRGSVRVVDPQTDRVVANGQGVQTWSEAGLDDLRIVRIDTATPEDPDALQLPLIVGAVRASSLLLDARSEAQVHSPQLDPTEPEVAATSRTEREPAEDQKPTPEKEPATLAEPTERLPFPLPAPGVSTSATTVAMPDPTAMESADTQLVQPPVPQSPGRTGPATPRTDVPTVLAVVCPHGHANPPGTGRCQNCSVRITDQQPRQVPQPVLATLRVSDGTEAPLDRMVLVGRAPTQRGDGRAGLLTVPSPGHDISRTHLELVPDGWRILVKDLNSTNGTVVIGPNGMRRSLPPGESAPIELGSVLELADGISVLLDVPQ